jgi:hypothetical protein
MTNQRGELRARANAELQRIEETVEDVYGGVDRSDREDLVRRFEAFFTTHPKRCAAKRDVAIHEAGHFVFHAVCGFRPNDARIYSSAFGRGGWGGEANFFSLRGYPRVSDYDATEFYDSHKRA